MKKTQKIKFWQNSQTQIVTKVKKTQIVKTSNCEKKTQKLKLWKNLKKNLNCDKTKKLKLWQNSKTQTLTKLKRNQIVTKLKRIKSWQISKSQIVMVVIVTVVTLVVRLTSFSKTTQQLDTLTSVWWVQGSFSQSCDV